MTLLVKDHTSDELHARLAEWGVSLTAVRRLQAAALRRGEYPTVRPGLSARTLDTLRQETTIPRLELAEKRTSPRDGFAKYLFRGGDGQTFEAVRIPLTHRAHDRKCIVCVSSQVGCPLGCTFCASGRLGYARNLAAWEIVDQVCQVQADAVEPVRGVVFMGIGEPLLNYDAVIRAARILSEPCGLAIAAKAISISTAGIVPGIRRFTQERQPYRLVVSLTAADPALRAELMPIERTYSTAELLAALREYHAASGRRLTLAWTMLAGVNTREEDARQLAALTQGLPIKLDLIDVNDPRGRHRAPSAEELAAFRDALRKHVGSPVARRYSGGQDIQAACGMLAGQCPTPQLVCPRFSK